MTSNSNSNSEHLFHAQLAVRVKIAGCPDQGLDALDWRREHGLPDRLDNIVPVRVKGEIEENEFRALLKAGYRAHYYAGGGHVQLIDLPTKHNPDEGCFYGHYATVPVHPEDSAIDLACRAFRSCAREAALDAAGGETKLREELTAAESRVTEIRRLLG